MLILRHITSYHVQTHIDTPQERLDGDDFGHQTGGGDKIIKGARVGLIKGKAQRRLQPTVARYGLELNESDWHGALADSRITGQLLLAQTVRYPHLFQVDVEELADAVAAWRDQQDREFKEWLARQPPRE